MATGANNLGATFSNASNYLKQWYIKGGGINRLMYQKDAFLSRLKKLPATNVVGGKEIILPVRVGRSPTASKNFAKAQEQAKARTGERKSWMLKVDEDYGVFRVENKAILASKNDRGAFVRLLMDEADSALMDMHQRLCRDIFASTAGVSETVKSRSGSTITLNRAHEATSFDIGDAVEFYTSAGVARAGNPYIVTKIDRSGLVVTFDKAVNSAVVANDLMYREGDRGVETLTGLQSWIPKTITGLGMLNNIDRSIDPLRLAGHRLQMAQNAKFATSIRKVATRINQLTGENPTIAVMSPLVAHEVAVENESQIRFDDAKGSGAAQKISAGIGNLSIKTAKGDIELVTSSFCPVDVIFVLNEADLALYYLSEGMNNDMVFFSTYGNDGNIFDRASDASGIEGRLERYCALGLQNPGVHGRVDLHSSMIPTA